MTIIIGSIFLFNGLTGAIQGTVTNQETGAPVMFANIIIANTETGTATDEKGNYYLLNLPSGRYTLEFSCLGFQTLRVEKVVVETDRTSRVNVKLQPTGIMMEPVVVTGRTPAVTKDMVGATYVIRKTELANLPIDYFEKFISFQPAVASVDTALHVRGGRSTEVQYLIDGVSIIDPQTNEPGIQLAKAVVDEVIFMPGGFDVEYGRAMSGVVNVITERPRAEFGGRVQGKTETIMPFYYDFGYQNYQMLFHLPLMKKLRGLLSGDLMHTDDWDPRLYVLPHKERNDYSIYTKWSYQPSGKFNVDYSATLSRSQFDRYAPDKYRLYPEHWRSDLRRGDLNVVNASYLPDRQSLLNLSLSRFHCRQTFGVRDSLDFGWFEDFTFRSYHTYRGVLPGNETPWGVYTNNIFWTVFDYQQFRDKTSDIYRLRLNLQRKMNAAAELRAGAEYTYQKLFSQAGFVTNDTLDPLEDTWTYHPDEAAVYGQGTVDLKGMYAKIGARLDYLNPDLAGYEPGWYFSPRIGFSFLMTERLLFRTNIGRYIQPPLYDHQYGYYQLLPLPPLAMKTEIPPIGNPGLKPENTMSYEIGFQGEINPAVRSQVNAYYKDVTELVGTRYVAVLPQDYFQYINVEYANIKGLEAILEFRTHRLEGKLSYTLSWARGTSSYAQEAWYRYYHDYPDSLVIPPAVEYDLDFDQRHRIFFQGTLLMPLDAAFHFLVYFGNGFPYTPPGSEGKYSERNISLMPFRRDIDALFTKKFSFGRFAATASVEIINLLDSRYEINPHGPYKAISEIPPWEFKDYYPLNAPAYHPAADIDHNGLITPYEEYTRFCEMVRWSDDWVSANSPPRRARIGLSVNF